VKGIQKTGREKHAPFLYFLIGAIVLFDWRIIVGLHFSPYYMLEQIIENEFANVVPPERAADFALRLLQSDTIRETIAKYEPGDDFDGSSEYDQLYTELTGVIVELLEADGVKVLP